MTQRAEAASPGILRVAAGSRSGGFAQTVALAASCGIIAGLLNALLIWLQRYVLGQLTWQNRFVIWMAPLGNLLIFAGLGVALALAGRFRRRGIPAELTVGAFGFLGLFTLLLPFGEIAHWAAALVALGGAFQLARLVYHAPERWVRRILAAAATAALLSASLGLVQQASLAVRRAIELSRLPEAAAGTPNVLLIILDTVREDDLSLYGYPKPTTPALERWASTGVVFENAFATAPWTLPSHGSLFTGQLPRKLGGSWTTPLLNAGPSVAEILREQGYRTAGFAANLGYTTPATGMARGFTEYRAFPVNLRQILLHAPLAQTVLVQSLLSARSPWSIRQALGEFDLNTQNLPGRDFIAAAAITDDFLAWQSGIADRPFFAFLNYFDAHAPYRSPREFHARFVSQGTDRERYDAAIAYLDSEIDRLLRTLERRAILDRTLVIVSSDHGEHFGEHGQSGHANTLYFPVLRVPLLIRYPGGVPAGVRLSAPVSLRDIPATILELASGRPEPRIPGVSLASEWDSTRRAERGRLVYSYLIQGTSLESRAPNAQTWLESLVDARYHYIHSGLGREELYEWTTDSLELINLSRSSQGREVIRQLRTRLGQEFSLSGH